MIQSLYPYSIAALAGALLALLASRLGVDAAFACGLVAAVAYAFGPPLPGARHEWERIGRSNTTHAVTAFFFSSTCLAMAILAPLSFEGSTLDPNERLIAARVLALMTWGVGIGAFVWGLFCARPRRGTRRTNSQHGPQREANDQS